MLNGANNTGKILSRTLISGKTLHNMKTFQANGLSTRTIDCDRQR